MDRTEVRLPLKRGWLPTNDAGWLGNAGAGRFGLGLGAQTGFGIASTAWAARIQAPAVVD